MRANLPPKTDRMSLLDVAASERKLTTNSGLTYLRRDLYGCTASCHCVIRRRAAIKRQSANSGNFHSHRQDQRGKVKDLPGIIRC